MTRQHRLSESFKSIAGAALVGLGLHLLWGNLDRAATQLSHLLGTAAGETLGVLPSAVLASSQAVQAYALDRQVFLLGLLRMLVSFWPLLLVALGAGLLKDVFTDEVDTLTAPEKYFQDNDTGCRFCCPSFDT